jgi:hypothetical protein
MHAIVKIVGVTPEAIAKLHTVLKQPNLQTLGEHCQPGKENVTEKADKVPYIKLMDSKFHPDSGTYTVTLRFNLIIYSYKYGTDVSFVNGGCGVLPSTPLVFPPFSAFREFFKSIDCRLLPETETTENNTVPIDTIDATVEKLSPILGEQSDFDIRDSATGEIIIPCRRKITRTLIRKLAGSIKNLDFDNGNDSVIRVLKRVRDEFPGEEKK